MTQAVALNWLQQMPRFKKSLWTSLICRARFMLGVLLYHMTGSAKPLFVVLVTNNDCNLDCSYCYGKYGKRSAEGNYSTVELLALLDDLWSMGTRILTLHGGESLLRQDIGEIINYAKRKGFYISLNTNGTLVPSKIDELRNIDAACISLDGTQQAHDSLRGKGSYQRALEAIRLLSDRGIPLSVHATLTRRNYLDLSYLAELGLRYGFRVQFSILYNNGNLSGDDLLTDQEIRTLIQTARLLKGKGYPVFYSDRVLNAALYWPYAIDSVKNISSWDGMSAQEYAAKHSISCYHGILKYVIDADGRVVTCWGNDDDAAPNIRTTGLEAALQTCREGKTCKNCCFLANNEHNLMFTLDILETVRLIGMQLADMGRFGRGRKRLSTHHG